LAVARLARIVLLMPGPSTEDCVDHTTERVSMMSFSISSFLHGNQGMEIRLHEVVVVLHQNISLLPWMFFIESVGSSE
jgi:hypothetical protein